MQLRVKLNTNETARLLNKFASRSVKWAASNALNEVAGWVKEQSIQRLYSQFTIRTNWVPNSFLVQRSKFSTLQSTVLMKKSSASFMWRHIEGSDVFKDPQNDQQGIPEQGSDALGIRTPRGTDNRRTTMQRSNWPGTLLDRVEKARERARASQQKARDEGRKVRKTRSKFIRGGIFVIRKGPDLSFIMQRLEKGRGPGKLRVLWRLQTDPVRIPAHWDIYKHAEEFAPRVFAPVFDAMLNKEIQGLR